MAGHDAEREKHRDHRHHENYKNDPSENVDEGHFLSLFKADWALPLVDALRRRRRPRTIVKFSPS
jgi:hypothetical protein